MKTYKNGNLRIDSQRSADALILTWHGESDARDPANFLIPYIEELSSVIEGRTLTLDLRRLEFMNSSTAACIITILRLLDERRIATRIVFDETVNWQRINLQCMRAIAGTLTHTSVHPRCPSGKGT